MSSSVYFLGSGRKRRGVILPENTIIHARILQKKLWQSKNVSSSKTLMPQVLCRCREDLAPGAMHSFCCVVLCCNYSAKSHFDNEKDAGKKTGEIGPKIDLFTPNKNVACARENAACWRVRETPALLPECQSPPRVLLAASV